LCHSASIQRFSSEERFRWNIVVHDPVYNQMLDGASTTYMSERYSEPVWLHLAADKDFRAREEQKKDGQAKHATMTETSVILALKPEWVALDYKTLQPHFARR